MTKTLRKLFIIAALLTGFCTIAFAQQAQNTEQRVFGNMEGIFIVVNNKAQFYGLDWDSDSWVHDSSKDFTLPNGYRSVYGYYNVICVIINNKVQRYRFNGNSWAIDSSFREFTLPNGYGSVFGSERNIGGICVVVNNKVQFYGFDGRTWDTDSSGDFTLPSGYRSVFGGFDGIGIAVGNKAQFYGFRGASGWVHDSRYDLTLPDGYRSVFGAPNDLRSWNVVFVVMNDRVLYYYFDKDKNLWTAHSDWDIILPRR